ncbi:CAF17-like 4Fe-4S cluster assembly/insertion protein YgfZ [Sphingopyxis sp. MC1]|uniref:CAF17-like 4Fe-4S cluster assembly/insertion protein YgfZ n=1 Tax=Sphingopyxis sp. MC1 TaxID=1174684 RepID=UPI0002D170E4|nr:glycine cleavage system protein T [Sphingopyxis sp. MC1]ENY80758.1 glycine cleavage T protein (aminomethyl transferase) [Sphingopyxis sp. MC1]
MANTTLNDRALIRLSGDDVRGFLQGLVTNDVSGNLPVWAALLTAQGKALFDFLIWADEADVLIDCEAAAADDLTRRLTLYRLRRSITIEREEVLRVHWAPEGDLGVVDPRLAELGQRWLAPADEDGAAGVEAAWRAHRLALGVTEGRAELGDGTTLWLECNAAELNGVSFSKGCYVGQENTARMNWRQKVNRRLVVVPIAEADEKRQIIAYPELGWSVEHRRVEGIDPAKAPAWMRSALLSPGS